MGIVYETFPLNDVMMLKLKGLLRETFYSSSSDMELNVKTGTVRYNNKILVSAGNFILGKNDEVNSLEASAINSHKTNSLETPAMKSTQTAVNSKRTADLEQKTIKMFPDTVIDLSSCVTDSVLITLYIFPYINSATYYILKIIQKS